MREKIKTYFKRWWQRIICRTTLKKQPEEMISLDVIRQAQKLLEAEKSPVAGYFMSKGDIEILKEKCTFNTGSKVSEFYGLKIIQSTLCELGVIIPFDHNGKIILRDGIKAWGIEIKVDTSGPGFLTT